MSKYIFLTFDYELFLHESGCPVKSLFAPTDKLLNILEKNKIKAVFYIDILYYHRISSMSNQRENCRLFELQIQKMVELGHDVELHLHPHWLDAIYEDNIWKLHNLKKYKLENLSEDEIVKTFELGIKLLSKICVKKNPQYRVKSFRAGGLCLPRFNILLNIFKTKGIQSDSSIAAGLASKFKNHLYDYSKIDYKYPYKFNLSPFFRENNGTYTEFPVSWFKVNLIDKIFLKLSNEKNFKFEKFGEGIPLEIKNNQNFLNKFKSLVYFFSLDHSNISYELLNSKIKNFSSEYITFISHPKLMSNKSFKILEQLILSNRNFLRFSDYVN